MIPNIKPMTMRQGAPDAVSAIIFRGKICLLKIEPPKDQKLIVPAFVSSTEMKVGQWAISLGVGYGDADPALSAGIIRIAWLGKQLPLERQNLIAADHQRARAQLRR